MACIGSSYFEYSGFERAGLQDIDSAIGFHQCTMGRVASRMIGAAHKLKAAGRVPRGTSALEADWMSVILT